MFLIALQSDPSGGTCAVFCDRNTGNLMFPDIQPKEKWVEANNRLQDIIELHYRVKQGGEYIAKKTFCILKVILEEK